MTTERKKAILSWVYPGDKWLDRLQGMPDHQVHAVYERLLSSGKLKTINPNIYAREKGVYVRYA